MTERMATRLGKRKEVICLSSDDDDGEDGSESDEDDDSESDYLETEDDDNVEEDNDFLETEDSASDSSSISGEEDLIDLSSDSEGPFVNRAEKQLNAEIAKSIAGNTGHEHDIPGVKLGKERGEVLNKADEEFYAEAMNVITGQGDMRNFTVEHCRAYLRKHCLRRTGSKEVLLKRIQEHLELKDGGGPVKYPRSTFVLNCTGDACTGDIVLFKQDVYAGYDIVSRSSALPTLGKRVVAGRIVKESYGEKKQQHTFTVEVLWSTGVKALPPLYPLIIKGRNLYRCRTFRQYWSNEEERRRALQEKHARGTAARSDRLLRVSGKHSRHTRKTKVVCNTSQNKVSYTKNVGNTHKRRRVDVTKGRAGNTTSKNGGSAYTKKLTMSTASSSQKERINRDANDKNYGSNTAKAIVSIKASLAGIVIGKGGTNIKEITRVSGAKLHVREDKQRPSLRLVHIEGRPEQIQVAREMVLLRLVK